VLLQANFEKSYCSREKAEAAVAKLLSELVDSISAPDALKFGVHWVVVQDEGTKRFAPIVVIVDPNLVILARSIALEGFRVYN
jgi:hypothetical protein